ncbi:uncharacterized protein LOC110446428 [Mizuhopecten yessoensis]|uniref:uncharacterized protein LOC110446428 n=1 Tax=Mizuhopecten yessoensis TaxID=6573 RepID=UPI000B458455|nr:uncharacterized protein LOC110446428 [Mizuhopecten yessoensis]
MYLLYVIVTRSDLSFMCFLFIYLFLSISLLIKICLRPPTINIDSINPGSILYGFKDCSFIVLMLLYILALPFISFYNAFQLIARYKRYRALFGPTYRNCRGNIKAWSDLFAWLFFCTVIAWMTYCVIVLTLIGITTNSVPYLPLVMASIVYWVKISARLSNWYRVFFETILEKVMSMIEKHSLEIMLQSRKNCFLVVRSRSPLQIQGDRLQVSGIPIFIDREGTLKLTKAFFHRCLKIRNERSHNNSFRTSSDAVRQLINVNIFLFIIALIIMSFGVVGELSTSYLTLVSLAGGVLPFLFDNFIIKDSSVSDIGADIILKHDLEYLVNSYEESFEIDGYPQTEQSILVSNGYELTTVRSHLSPDGQELSTVPSDSTTENITEVGDISEMNPLLSLNTCRDVKVRIQIEDDGQERKTEVQGDPSFIDIK